ncbi:hypothetical protein ES708_24147 [subsurface metagenome]
MIRRILFTGTPEKRAAVELFPIANTFRPIVVLCKVMPKIIASIKKRTNSKGIIVFPMYPCPKKAKEVGYLVNALSPRIT